MTDKLLRIILIVSLTINIFVLSSLAMYCTWLATGLLLTTFWRGMVSLFVWISTFGAGAIAFWKIVVKMSTSIREAGVSL